MRRLLVLLLLTLASPAMAQERSAAQHDTLVQLARVLGEAHALRQVCAGSEDPSWRSQFQQMLDVEAPDEAFGRQLQSAFNAGAAARRGDFAACSQASRIAEAEVALEGRELAAGLSRATIRVRPDDSVPDDPMAEDETPR